jgi:hypothetical protein
MRRPRLCCSSGFSSTLRNHSTRHRGGSARHPKLPASRRGAVLVFAMIALLVVSMIGASLLRTTLMSARQIKLEQQRLQASLLADAGCQRALTRMNLEPDYVSEDWTVPSNQLHSPSAGIVRITVAPVADSESSRTITVIAEYPQASVQMVRVTRQLVARQPMTEAQ